MVSMEKLVELNDEMGADGSAVIVFKEFSEEALVAPMPQLPTSARIKMSEKSWAVLYSLLHR